MSDQRRPRGKATWWSHISLMGKALIVALALALAVIGAFIWNLSSRGDNHVIDLLPDSAECIEVASYIAGGKPAPSPHPWMVRIGNIRNGTVIFFCGGSLISTHFVLTAAICEYDTDKMEAKFVRLGVYSVADAQTFYYRKASYTTQTVFIKKFHFPGGAPSKNHDIALVELVNDAILRSPRHLIQRICLPIFQGENGVLSEKSEAYRIAGWGKTGENKTPSHLQEAHVHVVPAPECSRQYKQQFHGDQETLELNPGVHVCAIGENNEDACAGDTGGPLEHLDAHSAWTVVGVVSYSEECAGLKTARRPSVITTVQPYLEWVLKTVKT